MGPCLPKGPTNSARMRTIVTALLQWQYLQTELILWIHLVHILTGVHCVCWKQWCNIYVHTVLLKVAEKLWAQVPHTKARKNVISTCAWKHLICCYSWNSTFIISAQNVLVDFGLVSLQVLPHWFRGYHFWDFRLWSAKAIGICATDCQSTNVTHTWWCSGTF
jgi:hypothetical protein